MRIDPVGDHWLEANGELGTRAPRSPLAIALKAHVVVADGVATLGGVELGRRAGDGWRPTTTLTPLELRYLADRGNPHPGSRVVALTRGPRTDLHTHFAGCVRGADLVAIGAAHGVVYPARVLAQLGVHAAGDVALATASDDIKDRIARALALPIDQQCTHQDMSLVYAVRRPITKHVPAFPALCRQVALDYAAMGVVYTELSVFDVLEPEVLRLAHEVVPRLRAELGVDLRFLAAFGRADDLAWDLDMIDRMRVYAGSDLIVGFDIMGHEIGSTRDFVPQLRAMAAFATAHRPDLVVRVHAGENPGHPENVRVAVDELAAAGARIRIGHGLYGVDDDTLARMAAAGVVVELNLDSNFALNNVGDALGVPLARYVASGVPIVLGTDGYGIYHGDTRSALRAAELTGLTAAGAAAIARTEDAVIEARREADARLATAARAFVVPATAPAAVHYTPEVVASARAVVAARSAALRAAIGASVVDAAALAPGKRIVSIAGAWRRSWDALDGETRARIAGVVDELVAGLAAAGWAILTGGTRDGVEGLVHAAARAHGATAIGAITEATPPAELDDVAGFCVVGRTLYDKACGLYRLVADRGGSTLFIGGGNIVHDEIRVAANLRLPRLFFAGAAGASGEAATRWPKHAFSTAAQALARLAGDDGTGSRVHAARRGASYYYAGANPTADAVCLRARPDHRDLCPAISAAEGQCGSTDRRDLCPAISAAEGRRGSTDRRDLCPAISAAEGRRGSTDRRDLCPAISAAEGRRGSIDRRDLCPAISAAEGRRGSIDGRREVLLIRRRDDVGAEAGRWALPGGFVHSPAARGQAWVAGAESFETAALRELAEETGLELGAAWVPVRAVGVYEGGGRDPRDTAERWSRSHAFAVELPPHLAAATLIAGDDAGDAAWHALDALPPLAFDHARIIADATGMP